MAATIFTKEYLVDKSEYNSLSQIITGLEHYAHSNLGLDNFDLALETINNSMGSAANSGLSHTSIQLSNIARCSSNEHIRRICILVKIFKSFGFDVTVNTSYSNMTISWSEYKL